MVIVFLIAFVFLPFTIGSLEDDVLIKNGKQQFKNIFQESIEDLEYELVSPLYTDNNGESIRRFRRDTENPKNAIFTINAFGDTFQFILHKKNDIVSENIEISERIGDGLLRGRKFEEIKNCYYSGHLLSHGNTPVAISTCNGLTGLISTQTEDFLIQPIPDVIRLKRSVDETDHVIYKRHRNSKMACGVDGRKQQLQKMKPIRFARQVQNALSAKVLTVETALFLDYDLILFYKKIYPDDTENQIIRLFLAIFNAVQQLYNDPSLTDKKVLFVIIKIEMFKSRQVGFGINPNAHIYLENFCQWQNKINIHDDSDPRHWDHAFMFSGIDLHIQLPGEAKMDVNGVASVAEMCLPEHSCTLCNGRSLVAVFTAAHECGHNFGMQHDAYMNDCTLPANFMMSGGEHVRPWSRCSKAYFYEYLSLPHSVCLLDQRQPTPDLNHERNKNVWLGQCFDMNQQCEISQGPGFFKDPNQEANSACEYLQCIDDKGNFGQAASHSAYEGSPCGNGMWCSNRRCVKKPMGVKEPPLGKWSNFELISSCQSPCIQGGTGFAAYRRKCVHNDNKYLFAKCEGETVKVDVCNDNQKCHGKRLVNDIAGDICRKYRKEGATGVGRQQINDSSKGCWAWCSKSSGDEPLEIFPNGTPCGDYKNKYCMSGQCKQF